MVKNTPKIASGQEQCVRPSSGCTETTSFPFFNREPDVKLSVRRCRVHGSFRGRDVPAT